MIWALCRREREGQQGNGGCVCVTGSPRVAGCNGDSVCVTGSTRGSRVTGAICVCDPECEGLQGNGGSLCVTGSPRGSRVTGALCV